MQRSLVVDWLTLLVQMPRRDFENHKCKFTIRKDSKNTRHFKQIHYIYTPSGDELGYVAHDPHSEILSQDTGLLKFSNKYLYQYELKAWVIALLADLGMKFKSISRIDLALDFQRFNNNLCPQNFIKGYMSDKYLKTGKCLFQMSGKEGKAKGKEFDTLKFGSGHSDVQYYLYNKTKEMKEVKHKQWIEDNWKANGYDGEGDVYRLEFRVKKHKKGVYKCADAQTGEAELIFNMESLDCLDNIHDVYSYMFNHYFTFVHNEKRTRKDRCKPVVLFSKEFETKGVAIKLSEKKEADRASRIFAKHLVKLEYELSGLDFGLAQWANEFTGYYCMSRGLRDWVKKKLDYTVSDRQQQLYHSRNYSALLTDAQYMGMMRRVEKSHNPLAEISKNIWLREMEKNNALQQIDTNFDSLKKQ